MQKEAFVKAGSTHSVRMFLEWFVETASFATFIELRLSSGLDTKGILFFTSKSRFGKCNELSLMDGYVEFK